ncbi:tyrosine-type recombinase/integrase [Tunturiibacter gelidoferens]|uniref:Integrase n=1 Tax=Tunturiibacter gelidiferens TaxID=3069689 RepID=A0A9X0U5F5_9BACT|nr:tyrosine-type recombinase/integrase [Edaphobacter lichenicola]MBB5329995.1 integrase [Edaphobacter lichenicola]
MSKRRGNREGSIRKRADGKGWIGAVMLGHDPSGKAIRVFFKRQRRDEVVEAIKDAVKNISLGTSSNSKRLTVSQHIARWLDVQVKPNKSPNSYRGYEQTSRMYIVPMLGAMQLDQLNVPTIQEWMKKMSELSPTKRHAQSGHGREKPTIERLSPTSIKRAHATLRTALSTAVKWGLISTNPARGATPPKQIKYDASPLTAQEAIDYMKTRVGDRYEATAVLALGVGLRKGEVIALKWDENVTWLNEEHTAAQLNVTQSRSRVKGEGVKLLDVKTKSSRRKIALPSFCVAALERRRVIQEQERLNAGKKWQDTGFVFTSRDGAAVAPERINTDHDEALRVAKIRHVRFHDLRHTAATLLHANGVNLSMIQEMLGHSSAQITAEFYAHVVAGQRNEASNVMQRLLGAESPTVVPTVAPRASTTVH